MGYLREGRRRYDPPCGTTTRESEAGFTQAVMDLARTCGWLVYHTHDSRHSERGFPDLVLVHAAQGRLLVAELKTARGRTAAAQVTWLEALARAGVAAYLWRPADWPEIARTLADRGRSPAGPD